MLVVDREKRKLFRLEYLWGVWDKIQVALVISAILYLVIAGFPGIAPILVKLIAIVLVANLLMIRRLHAAISAIQQDLQASAADGILPDIVAAFPALVDSLNKVQDPTQKSLDVLGLTLQSTWPVLAPWIGRPATCDWSVNFLIVDPESALTLEPWLDHTCFSQAEMNCSAIVTYAIENESSLNKKRVSIQLYTYKNIPVVQGFRIGNGELFISIGHWTASGRLAHAQRNYYHFLATDQTQQACAARALYDNWLRRAIQGGKVRVES